jgi:2-polyprenyl-3-methyl-5-hydroxy-6-metoxy-1,4-benzoquinol methylase
MADKNSDKKEELHGTDKVAHEKNNLAHRAGITNAEVIEYYNKWAEDYEKVLFRNNVYSIKLIINGALFYFLKDSLADGYRGFEIAADFCDILEPNKSARILDVGCGTGFCGVSLKKLGFKNFDGLDPSQDILKVARQKGIYQNLICDGIHADKQTNIANDSYDVVLAPGVFIEGHVPAEGLRELARMAKSGGLIIVVMREEYLTSAKGLVDKLEPLMEKMEKDEGVWKRLLRIAVPKYSFIKSGVAFIFRKN